MIRKAENVEVADKRIRILIAGYPGIGKSTLALSAPRPLHIDVDFGIDRIEPRYRADYIQPKSYDEILDDLKPENLSDYDTLVFDTGGKLISLMSIWAIRKDAKYGQRDGSLSLKGYGFVGKEFQRLMDYCFYELKKHIVMVFHAIEDKDGDNTRLRIKVEGQTKNNVWETQDLGGFVEMIGNDRTIGFSNCERYFAKGTRGVHGVMRIPTLTPTSPNDFLTRLFEQYNAKSAEEVAQATKDKEAYDAAIEAAAALIQSVVDAKTANEASVQFKKITHALTSQRETAISWNNRIKELGLFYDKVLKEYTVAPEGMEGK
jgi:hypothetical protein